MVIVSGDSDCDDFLDVSEEGTVPQRHPAQEIDRNRDDQHDLVMADCVSDTVSADERVTTEVRHTQRKLTVPTL